MYERVKPATLNDVANLSGVSYQTVSRVINNSPHVASQTRRRVQDAIAQLDYRPNTVAKMLVTRRSYLLEVIAFGVNYYGPAQMMSSIERAAKPFGYRILFSNFENSSAEEIQGILMALRDRSTDGRIIITPIQSVFYDDLIQACRGTPFIQVGNQTDTLLPSVIIDQRAGGQIITQHLIDLGHRHIAEISGPLYWYDARARHESWIATLHANGLCGQASIAGDWSAASGYQAVQHLLRDYPTISAIVVANDQMALGAMHALRERGLRVPADISVVGFDNIPESAYYDPPLTTVEQDFVTLGQQSVEYLVRLIENAETSIEHCVLPARLIVRNSTAHPAASFRS